MNNEVEFILSDDFKWIEYEKDVYKKIINISMPVKVIWDLRKMMKLPSFDIIIKQINLLKKERTSIKNNITNNIIIVSSYRNKFFLLWIFKYIYTPENKTTIYTEKEWNK
tara:strand:+ start:3644 stop:3973 length:330 start_codon:yes stop_codon:yes gene_type:complete